MVAAMFYVEMIVSAVVLTGLWALYVLQWMALRCTHHKKRNETKVTYAPHAHLTQQ